MYPYAADGKVYKTQATSPAEIMREHFSTRNVSNILFIRNKHTTEHVRHHVGFDIILNSAAL
jgi:hypothetical protein